MTFLLVVLAGGLGAIARFMLDGLMRSRVSPLVPVSTIVINVSGSLLLGLLAGLVLGGAPAELKIVLGTGFLGGYTTFSTAMIETARLLQGRRWNAALITGVGMLLLALAAAVAGVALGLALR